MRVVISLVLSVLAGLTLVGCSGPSADPVTIELVIPEGGLAAPIEQEVPLGARTTLRVTTPFADTVHVHGYELTFDTRPGEPAKVSFDATMAGTYEVESHVSDEIYMKLVVR